MIDDDVYEPIPEDVIRLKDDILGAIEATRTDKVIMSLMSALVEVIATTGPSLEHALQTIDHLKISMSASLKACDQAGVCNWNKNHQ